ncbi:MAG: hypothetical protein RLZZ612_380 [Pseudomonadota bacterium]
MSAPPQKATLDDQPLGLTIHSLPDPKTQAAASVGQTRGARIKLLLLFLVCAAPVIASYFTYYVIRPDGRRSYGELIDPQRTIPQDLMGVNLAGQTHSLMNLKHQWLLVTVADSACDALCQKHLYLSRQLRESLAKDKDRVDWVWLHTGPANVSADLLPALATAQVWKVDARQLAAWLQPAAGQSLTDHLYVVDPMGNWMMRFPVNVDPSKARKDLERLMRASNSWDQAGRP